ncbi:MAG: tetratricopeptide repeat protein, partial [Microcystis panniformis]
RKQLLGDNHPDVATSLNNLALLYSSQGRYTEAEPLYLQALDLRKQLLGDNHPHVATSLNNLAELYRSQGRYTEAEPLYLEALAIAEQALGENHPNTIIFRENLQIMRQQQKPTSLTWWQWIIVIPIVILWMPFYLLWMLTRWLVRRFIRSRVLTVIDVIMSSF